MANTYPYVASGGPINKTIDHLRRKSFPKDINADTLRKLGVAPNNESYVINVLRFLGIVDVDGKKIDDKSSAFVHHDDSKFQESFSTLVSEAYSELFTLHGADAWSLSRGELIQFFRSSDHSTEIVGTRQATTFRALAALAGHGDAAPTRERQSRVARPTAAKKEKFSASVSAKPTVVPPATAAESEGTSTVGLTVRIEVNLPAGGDEKTYDSIFRSIRKNLIDGSAI